MLLNLHNLEDWVPFSTLDYPGELSAVLFFKGCPYRCHYCQNPHLLDFEESRKKDNRVISPQSIELQTKFLPKRKKLLAAIVLSGGEALFECDLEPLILRLKEQGYKVGLHTAGSFPSKLLKVIENLDWIGLDIKTIPSKYDQLTHSKGAWNKTMESLKVIQNSGISYECRVSTAPSELKMDELFKLIETMIQLGVSNWVVQELRSMNKDISFRPYSPQQQKAFLRVFSSKFEGLSWRKS
ncbi:anaerobic ribonucleoside-triphosphate reductase activating protein [Fibrobacterales bacterium]|nr:anaerobic ribonucleoside-triphosphate reductase activating protein [Fibrobacterales bacterium]